MDDTGFMYIGTSPDALHFAIPYPDEAPFTGQDIVEGGRTVSGNMVMTQISRTMEKQALKWKTIDTPSWWYAFNRWVRDNGKAFYCRYYSYAFGEWVTRMMYAGDISCTPALVEKGSNKALILKDATRNIIDMGEA